MNDNTALVDLRNPSIVRQAGLKALTKELGAGWGRLISSGNSEPGGEITKVVSYIKTKKSIF